MKFSRFYSFVKNLKINLGEVFGCLATDLTTCADARPGEQEVVPAAEEVGQPSALARPWLVGSPLHLRHLLQDALPPMHQQQVCHIAPLSPFKFNSARKWQDSALTWLSSAAGLASLASIWVFSHYHQSPATLANFLLARLPEQVTRLVKLS